MRTILTLATVAVMFGAETPKDSPPTEQVAVSDAEVKQMEVLAKQHESLSKEIRIRDLEARAATAERMLLEGEAKKAIENQRSVINRICEKSGHKADCDQWMKRQLDQYVRNQQKQTPQADTVLPQRASKPEGR